MPSGVDEGDIVLEESKTELPSVEANHLTLSINGHTILHDIDFQLPPGARCMVLGPNGAGKTTLLRTLNGRHSHKRDMAKVLGRSCFYDTKLNMMRAYLGTHWGERTVAFSGFGMVHNADVKVSEMMKVVQERHSDRRDELCKMLDVDLEWHMHALSDGQRRRVQIMLQLLVPPKVLLMDEVTTGLDVVSRSNFLNYVKNDCETNGTTCLYATHVFDGMDDWATHILYLNGGVVTRFGLVSDNEELQELFKARVTSPVYRLVEKWMRADKEAELKAREDGTATGDSRSAQLKADPTSMAAGLGNGFLDGRLVRDMFSNSAQHRR